MTYKAYVSGSIGNFKLNIFTQNGIPIFVSCDAGNQLFSNSNNTYTYSYPIQADSIEEAIILTKNLRIVWALYNGFY